MSSFDEADTPFSQVLLDYAHKCYLAFLYRLVVVPAAWLGFVSRYTKFLVTPSQ